MILIRRGTEPAALARVRAEEMKKLKALKASGQTPSSDDIDGYREPCAWPLYKAQHGKCCYCEQQIKCSHNHVEHFRPKGRAKREPGCTETGGYWWLAYTWENLLFACPSCNTSAKKDFFPLAHGSIVLKEHELPPGKELALLLDPAGPHNPVCEIVFQFDRASKTSHVRHWYARPRNESQIGAKTIEVLKLNCIDLLDMRDAYFNGYIAGKIKELDEALKTRQEVEIRKAYRRALELLRPSQFYVGLAYDALCHSIENARLLAAIQVGWPEPQMVGLP